MPIYNGEYVKRCPKGYRKDKKTDQCVLIRKPTKFRVATGGFSSVVVGPSPPRPPPPTPPPPTPPTPPKPPKPPPTPPPDPSTPSKDSNNKKNIGKIIGEVSAPLFLYALAIAFSRYEGQYNLTAVFQATQDILTTAGESFGEGLFPEPFYQAIETSTTVRNSVLRSIRTRADSILTNRVPASQGGGIAATEEETVVEMITRADRSTPIVTQLQQNQINVAQALIDDAKAARDAAAADRDAAAADRAAEMKQTMAEDYDIFDKFEADSKARLVRMDARAANADKVEEVDVAANETEDALKQFISDADNLGVLDQNTQPIQDMMNRITTQQLQQDAKPTTVTTPPKQTQKTFFETAKQVWKDSSKKVEASAKKVVGKAFDAAREVEFRVNVRLANLSNRLPVEVTESLRQAEATDEEIYNTMLEVENDPKYIKGLEYSSDKYKAQMTRKLYEKIGYNTQDGTITKPSKMAQNIQDQQAEQQVSSMVDEFGQPSAIQMTDTRPVVPAKNIRIKTKYTITDDKQGLIEYTITEGDPVVIKLSKNGREKLSEEDFINETDGVKFDSIEEIEEARGVGGNADFLDREDILDREDRQLKATYEELKEDAQRAIRETLDEDVDLEAIDEWAATKNKWTQELQDDLRKANERRVTFTETVDNVLTSAGDMVDATVETFSNAMSRFKDFATGESTPIYDLGVAAEEAAQLGTELEEAGAFATLLEEATTSEEVAADLGAMEFLIAGGSTLYGAATAAGVAAAAGEEGMAIAMVYGTAAVGFLATQAMVLAALTGATILVAEMYDGPHHYTPTPLTPIQRLLDIMGIYAMSPGSDGTQYFLYDGEYYTKDQMPMVFRDYIYTNKSVQKLIVESLQNRYKRSEFYDPDEPYVMNYIRNERPIVTRQFQTHLRKKLNGSNPYAFMNNFTEMINMPNSKIGAALDHHKNLRDALLSVQHKIYEKTYEKQIIYETRQNKIQDFKDGRKDRSRLKSVLKTIAEHRIGTGVFIESHPGDIQRVNNAIHYLDTHDMGPHYAQFVYDDKIQEVLESYNEQQMEHAQGVMDDNNELSQREQAIVGKPIESPYPPPTPIQESAYSKIEPSYGGGGAPPPASTLSSAPPPREG